MLVRFSVQGIGPYSHRKQGLLMASGRLLDEGCLERREVILVRDLVAWLRMGHSRGVFDERPSTGVMARRVESCSR